jgi:hypothetical protein
MTVLPRIGDSKVLESRETVRQFGGDGLGQTVDDSLLMNV